MAAVAVRLTVIDAGAVPEAGVTASQLIPFAVVTDVEMGRVVPVVLEAPMLTVCEPGTAPPVVCAKVSDAGLAVNVTPEV